MVTSTPNQAESAEQSRDTDSVVRRPWPDYYLRPRAAWPRAEIVQFPCEACVEHLAADGAGLLLPLAVAPGQHLTLTLDPGDGGPPVEVEALVAYALPHRRGCRAGTFFRRPLSADEQRRLL